MKPAEMEGKPLETVLADWLENAQAARRLDHDHDAELIERVIRDVQQATEDYRRELSELAAVNYSGTVYLTQMVRPVHNSTWILRPGGPRSGSFGQLLSPCWLCTHRRFFLGTRLSLESRSVFQLSGR